MYDAGFGNVIEVFNNVAVNMAIEIRCNATKCTFSNINYKAQQDSNRSVSASCKPVNRHSSPAIMQRNLALA